ncbi:MAG: CaiB/BaiF CoA-transferase family protein [Hydrogenophaga sp.]|uniref:CaiB/BaiF CoA transferase family protein n=1 Tax=Hydrogenophaga sp. TaxID=1904254 RepID=UPI002ABBA4B7|nr:CaiB/BaiF CoA-transferase family protein [Hydrogenophaga sp.]MDZ4173126.1 CaiB/BaiF CoA-transferase family protein [Hydrogenophaga sp.]
MPGPLSGITIVEIAGIGPAPFACMILADLGATVIRIDRPVGPASDTPMEDLLRNDSIVDRGRQSVALNLKDPRATEVVLRLVAKADILIEGFRPGVMEKLGLGPQVCLRRNPKLIFGRMTGWGQYGPLAQTAGHDINYIALSGALHGIGPKERPAVPLNLIGDYGGGGMLLTVGVLAALQHATRKGVGQVVDAAMTDGAALLLAAQYGFLAKGVWQDQRESNFLDGAAHFYGIYDCADGKHVAVGAIEPQFYQKFLKLMEIDDPSFQDQWDVSKWPDLRQKLEAIFLQRTRDEWTSVFEGTDACVTPVLSLVEAAEHPHTRSRQTLSRTELGIQPSPAPRFGVTLAEMPPHAPVIGSATLHWLEQAGLHEHEIQDLLAEQVAHAAPHPGAPTGNQAQI